MLFIRTHTVHSFTHIHLFTHTYIHTYILIYTRFPATQRRRGLPAEAVEEPGELHPKANRRRFQPYIHQRGDSAHGQGNNRTVLLQAMVIQVNLLCL